MYVEGMEDDDMKKETQNLAYPPAFKLGETQQLEHKQRNSEFSILFILSEVAMFAKKHSQYAAAKIFNVARYL